MVIKNCKIVNYHGIVSGGVAVKDERICSISRDSNLPDADVVIDGKGKYLIPGAIDPHNHYIQGPEIPDAEASIRENVKTEPKSSAAGGITTILDLSPVIGHVYEEVDAWIKYYEKYSVIDFSLHLGVPPVDINDIPRYVHEKGISSFKHTMAYAVGKPPELATAQELEGKRPLSDAHMYWSFKKISEVGSPAVAMVHCENFDLLDDFGKKLRTTGRRDLAVWTESRPWFCEADALNRVILLARATGVNLYIPHLTISAGVDIIEQALSTGVNVVAETCPHYLTLTKDDERIGPLGKVNPPLRGSSDIVALWSGINRGIVKTMGSDHCTSSKSQKMDIWNGMPGFSGTETILPVLMSEGVNKGRITLEKLVEICCYNSAKAFGIYPRKGEIMVGADADLVLLDLDREITVSPDILHSRCDFTLYDGWKLKGWPIMTIVRGNLVMEDRNIVGKPGIGRFLPRKKPIVPN